MRGVRGHGLAIAVLVLTSCGGGSSSNPNAVDVRLVDFRLHTTVASAQSGSITLRLDNVGPSTHELNVDRTDLREDQLPLRANGLSVAENSPLLTRIGSVEILEAGDKKNLTLDLPPGHYVLYCNLEGHYLGRMYATLDVH